MIRLRRCPFCRGKAEMVDIFRADHGDHTYWARCTKCLATTSMRRTADEAADLWNGRLLAAIRKIFRKGAE